MTEIWSLALRILKSLLWISIIKLSISVNITGRIRPYAVRVDRPKSKGLHLPSNHLTSSNYPCDIFQFSQPWDPFKLYFTWIKMTLELNRTELSVQQYLHSSIPYVHNWLKQECYYKNEYYRGITILLSTEWSVISFLGWNYKAPLRHCLF